MEVEDFQDLIRLLQARPEWRADLRRVVLTDELLALPEQIARLQVETDRRFHELAGQIAALAEAQRRTEGRWRLWPRLKNAPRNEWRPWPKPRIALKGSEPETQD